MTKSSSLKTHTVVIRDEVTATIVEADSNKQREEFFASVSGYDLVVTSPPWPGYDNECNDIGGVDIHQWRDISIALADFCKNARGLEGVRGLIELPSNMTAEEQDTINSELSKVNLQVGARLDALRWTGNNNTVTHQWWVVLDKQIAKHLPSLTEKTKKLIPILAVRGTPAKNAHGLREWKIGAGIVTNGLRVRPPAQFNSRHFKALISTYTSSGDTVLDPYAGTGTCLEYCANHSVHSIGIEKVPAYAEGIRRRINYLRDGSSKQVTRSSRGTRSQVIEYTILRDQNTIDQLGLVDRDVFIAIYTRNRSYKERKDLLIQHQCHEYRKKTHSGTGRAQYLYYKPDLQKV